MNNLFLSIGANSPPQAADLDISTKPVSSGDSATFKKTLKSVKDKQVEESEKDEKPKDTGKEVEPRPEIMSAAIQVIIPEQAAPVETVSDETIDLAAEMVVATDEQNSAIFTTGEVEPKPTLDGKNAFSSTLLEKTDELAGDPEIVKQPISPVTNLSKEEKTDSGSNLIFKETPVVRIEMEEDLNEEPKKIESSTLQQTYPAAVDQELQTGSVPTSGTLFESARSAETRGSEIIRQLAPALDNLVQKGESTIRLQLNPQDLGKVELTVISKKNGLEINLVADTPATQRLLEADLNNLRQHLSASGIEIANLNIGQQPQQSFARESQTGQGSPRKRGSNYRTLASIAPINLRPDLSLTASGVDYKI